jgi:hypothetical protein
MHTADIGTIVPMGLMVGAHVTPIDHMYYYQKNQQAPASTYEVLSPADGVITEVGFRNKGSNADGTPKGDYRVVITYSCTFFSYFDLATSLAPDIANQLQKNWETSNNPTVHPTIAVTSGQVLAKVGGQSLDFAVWDTTKTVSGLLVPRAYNNAEPWKISTVPPLDYFTNDVKTSILPFYLRTTEPRDGTIGYDQDGKAIGNWFKAGSNGYLGSKNPGGPGNYSITHLSLSPDHIDTKSYIASIGNYNGEPKQFALKATAVDPATVTVATGVVTYELAELQYADGAGKTWTGSTVASGIHVVPGPLKGILLIQMTGDRTMKVEVFPGKTAAEVTGFTSGATMYDRGQDAVMVTSNTAT